MLQALSELGVGEMLRFRVWGTVSISARVGTQVGRRIITGDDDDDDHHDHPGLSQ